VHRRFRVLMCLLAVTVLPISMCGRALAGLGAGPAPAGGKPLILISIDGYRADYLDRGHSPVLAALAADGVRAKGLRPVFPSLTFPNHYTIVTGLYPDEHGIVNNTMHDPVPGKFQSPQSGCEYRWTLVGPGGADLGYSTEARATYRVRLLAGDAGRDPRRSTDVLAAL